MNSFPKGRAEWIAMGALCVMTLMPGRGHTPQDALTESDGSETSAEIRQSSSGNLRTLHFEVRNSRYAINGVELPRLEANSTIFSTTNHAYKVRVTLLKTVLISDGKSIDQGDRELLEHWSQDIPKISAVIRQRDLLGSLKVVSYGLIGNQNHQNLQLQEQLMLLWSADPAENRRAGQTGLGRPMRFNEPIVDVQYRTPNFGSDRLLKKTYLQIFYLQRGNRRMALGSFVITSTPSGGYEFYLVPRSALDRVVIDTK